MTKVGVSHIHHIPKLTCILSRLQWNRLSVSFSCFSSSGVGALYNSLLDTFNGRTRAVVEAFFESLLSAFVGLSSPSSLRFGSMDSVSTWHVDYTQKTSSHNYREALTLACIKSKHNLFAQCTVISSFKILTMLSINQNELKHELRNRLRLNWLT